MAVVHLETHKSVAIVRLVNGVTNSVNLDLVSELSVILKRAREEYRGLVLTGGEKFFCIGLELPSLLKLDRSGMTEFFYKFHQSAFDLFTLPIPTATAVKAHAIGAGTVYLLTGDYRIGSSGRTLVGLNEIKLGLPAPYLADLMVRQIAGDVTASEMLLQGEFIQCSDVKDSGVFHEVCSKDEVEQKALARVQTLARLLPKAFKAAKANRVEAVRARYESNYRQKNEEFLDCWFSLETQDLLREGAKKF